MSGIKAKNTKPEMIIRKALHAAGFRYRLHVRDLPGKPDLVFPKYKAVIFIHGCFWHGHECRYFKLPATRTEFWRDKINTNHNRDTRQQAQLRAAGWRVLVVWECVIRRNGNISKNMLIDCIANWLIMGNCDSKIDDEGIRPLPCLMTESVTTPKA